VMSDGIRSMNPLEIEVRTPAIVLMSRVLANPGTGNQAWPPVNAIRTYPRSRLPTMTPQLREDSFPAFRNLLRADRGVPAPPGTYFELCTSIAEFELRNRLVRERGAISLSIW
jgi:hypothetical protein